MRKMVSLLLIVAAVFMAAGMAMAQSSPPQVGVTQSGVYFLSDALLKQCNSIATGDPTVQSSLTGGWGRDNPMSLNKKEFWIYKSGRQIKSRQEFNVQIGYSNYWVAHLLVDLGVLEDNERDTGLGCISVRNGQGGYNFHCTPIAKAPWE